MIFIEKLSRSSLTEMQRIFAVNKFLGYTTIFILILACNSAAKSKVELKDLKLKNEILLLNGVPFEGTVIEKYSSQELKMEVDCIGGKFEGEYSEYYKNGNLKGLMVFKDGIAEGEFKKFFSSGKIKEKGYFKNGFYQDTIVIYYENGLVKETGKFEEGKKEGVFIKKDSIGNFISKVSYRDDKTSGESIYYFSNHKIEMINNNQNGVRNGYYKNYYFDNQKYYCEGNYLQGKEDSVWLFQLDKKYLVTYDNGEIVEGDSDINLKVIEFISGYE